MGGRREGVSPRAETPEVRQKIQPVVCRYQQCEWPRLLLSLDVLIPKQG